jgi:beta-galactosidase
MHAGLLRPDSVEDAAAHEARQVASELPLIGAADTGQAPVALLFSYEANWLLDIQKQGASFHYTQLCFEWYAALRDLGLDVDIIDPRQSFSGYKLILAPSLPIVRDDVVARLKASDAIILFGPRSGSKTEHYSIPDGLAPGVLRALLPMTVGRVESLRPNHSEAVSGGGAISRWLEHIEGDCDVLAETGERAVWVRCGDAHYLGAWPDKTLLRRVLAKVCEQARLQTLALPDGLRLRRRGRIQFAFNYSATPVDLSAIVLDAGRAEFVLGDLKLPPAGVAAWRIA